MKKTLIALLIAAFSVGAYAAETVSTAENAVIEVKPETVNTDHKETATAQTLVKNQYGGYDNVDLLSASELEKFKQTPRYKEVMAGLVGKMQKFDTDYQAALKTIETTQTIVDVPEIPDLTAEEKSFLTSSEINSWNDASKKLKEVHELVKQKFNAKSQTESALQAGLAKIEQNVTQQAEAIKGSMNDLPEQIDSSFERDPKTGQLIFKPKIDLNSLPEFKIPESNCDLLDENHNAVKH